MPFDSAVLLTGSPSETLDGHHGHLIEAAMREVLGDTYDRPVSQHRFASKQLVIRGQLIVPFGTGWVIQSDRNFDAVLEPGAEVVGIGAMPAPVVIDGSSYGRFDATRGAIVCTRPYNGGRTEVPRDGFVIQKSTGPDTPNQTHFSFKGKVTGLWRDVGYRGGFPGYTLAQEDHFKSPEIQVIGNYDIWGDLSGEADLCRFGVLAGNEAPSNNRRHYYGLVHVAWCETAVKNQRTALTIDTLIADGCRDTLVCGSGRTVINGGETEMCARLVNDTAWDGHDFPLVMRDVYAKLDGWQRGMGGIEPRLNETAFAVWGGRGNCYFQNCTIQGLPVKRTEGGTLQHTDGGKPPKFWTAQPIANVFFEQGTSVHGYTRGEVFAFERQGHGTCRTEVGYKEADPDGFVRRTLLTADNDRGT